MGLLADARSMREKDPAARTLAEVMLLYPGFHALVFYKVSHWLFGHRRFFLARMVSQWGRGFTGIEIHPGAKFIPVPPLATVCSSTTAQAWSSARPPKSATT